MDKLRVGILGLRRGITHLRNFLALEEAEVIGACDRLEQYRDKGCELTQDTSTRILREYDDLLALEPDAVVVASNGRQQLAHAVQALEAGCHVLSEVPGAYTLEEWVRLRDVVERTGRTYMLGENLCFMDFIRYWRRWFEQDRFGPVSLAEAEYLHYLPATLHDAEGNRLTPGEIGGRTDVAPIWRADQPPIQYLTHDLAPLLEVLDDRCVSVSCVSGPWRNTDTPLRPDGQFALFQTARGSLIKILITLSTRQPFEHRFRIMGVAGSAEWFSYEGFCRLFDRNCGHGDGWQRVDIGTAARDEDATAGHGGTDLKLARHFTRAVLEDRPVPIDVYRGIEYSLPGIMAQRSADIGGAPVPIPDLRPTPYAGTQLWGTVGLPEKDPPIAPYDSGKVAW